ncbi:dynein regulatory complex subunit 3 isoform X1 [Podarcis raffonei]|uniref:dynein regulatory complex subunit 3 isoform X1 n=1 Tax=Podarcis raffonei TaxID=65483 RepID=UPI0023290571|nr:dynein regulatory complex subunit 3 isoform X1 [Podarcis raffonei]XP_053222174.1 dynein regulatory complex subunit 3 isoform X1 [Podarcis raffonei]XP_053222175.1 dynein regulatory complex subunit 3 isoform X1 [Podarcis raffonei]
MSRLYDSIEPNVIDDEMLQKAVEEQGPQEEAGLLAKKEGINFKDVLALQLDFRNILKIDNLWQFKNLTKLQLDNNIIEKIEALDTLVHLVWLDLSFNNIEVIEGLDALVKLQDLSLYNNRISKIENLDTLQELQVFSIGNNNIQTLENVIYLRKFQNLRTLNLTGNPVCENEVYSAFIAAYLPDLVYLDFRLVDDNSREMALIKYQYAIEEMRHGETLAMAKQQVLDAQQKQVEYHKVIDTIQNLSDNQVIEIKLAEYNYEITKLSDMLMTEEMLLVDQLEEVIKDFERNIADLVSNFIENEQGMMAQCRDLENQHHEKLLEISVNTLEKIVKSEFDEEMPDDVRMLFVDKDTIVNAVNASHDIHLLKIDNREDEIITKANGWASTLVEKVHKTEIQRNRSRVLEINQYVDHLRSELDNMDILET